MLENIMALFTRADGMDRQAGMTWYQQAHNWCRTWATELMLPLENVAGVLAVLSPRNKWERNLSDTLTVLRAHKVGIHPNSIKVATYGTNKLKAFQIAAGHLDVLSGVKVTSFWDNILRPDSSKAVTVDVWAARIAMGDLSVNPGTLAGKRYNEIADGYLEASEVTGLMPHQIQAVTWMAARTRVFARTSIEQLPLF
jgi:hypothetical protein